jgi:CO/xanthine dehydrogenase FAD-binding subunit
MSMNSFDLHNPTSVPQAIALLDPQDANNRRVRLMAGGQDLLSEMKERLVEPESVVNLKHIPGLDRLTYDPNKGLTIGTLVKVADVADNAHVKAHFPALAMAAASVGSPQIRHMGTIGGNLCQRPRCWYYRNENIICLKKGGDRCYAAAGENKYNAILGGGPSWIVHPSDTAPALVALNASVVIAGPKGTRTLPLEEFFILPSVNVRHENVLKPDEIVPTTFLLTSFYWDNFIYFGMGPRKGPDGTLAITLPMGNEKLPGIAAEDIGRCAYGIFKQNGALIGKTVGIAGEHLSGAQMAAALGKALGREVRYNEVSPEAYRGFGFPGAEDLGNMFQFNRDFASDFGGVRDVQVARSLNPALQTFDQWLAQNKSRIPLE